MLGLPEGVFQVKVTEVPVTEAPSAGDESVGAPGVVLIGGRTLAANWPVMFPGGSY